MSYEQYLQMPNAAIPGDIEECLSKGGDIHLTPFAQKNDILSDTQLQSETGYRRTDSGNYQVSMICPMPGVTAQMINWWFWWHPQDNVRYQLWFPGEHFNIHYDSKDEAYFRAETVPDFQPNSQYPTEKIGGIRMPLRIDFVRPEEFGFHSDLMEECSVAVIVCGHVSAFGGMIPHTEMAHIFFQREDGLFLVSRFWLGETLQNRLVRYFILTEETARGMAAHCCVEYRNLAAKLPGLYAEYAAI